MKFTVRHTQIILILLLLILLIEGWGKRSNSELSEILDSAFSVDFPKEFTVIETKRDNIFFGNITYTIQISPCEFDYLMRQIEKSKRWKQQVKFERVGSSEKFITIPIREWERINIFKDYFSFYLWSNSISIAKVKESSRTNVTLYVFKQF